MTEPTPDSVRTLRPGRASLLWTLLACSVYITVELVSLGGLTLMQAWKGIAYEPAVLELSDQHRDILGSLIRDEFASRGLHSEFGWYERPFQRTTRDETRQRDRLRTINAQGVRGTQPYAERAPSGINRVAAFGDSFTFGAWVDDQEAWAARLEAADPNLEVLNFGVGGYGVDQAFLRYEAEARTFEPDIVLIGYLTENIRRHVNTFRPFYLRSAGMPAAKPRFLVEGDSLRLLPNPLPSVEDYEGLLEDEVSVLRRLGRHDYFYSEDYHSTGLDFLPTVRLFGLLRQQIHDRRSSGAIVVDNVYNVESEAFKVTSLLIEKFYRTVLEDGSTPVVLIFPDAANVGRFEDTQERVYQPLREYLEQRSIRYVDLVEAFAESGGAVEDFFNPPPEGHYSPEGNRIVSDYLLRYLRSEGLIADLRR